MEGPISSTLERNVSRLLAVRRRAMKMSQARLAKTCGLHPTYIGLLERNTKSPTLRTLFRILTPLEIAPHAFLKEAEEMTEERYRRTKQQPGVYLRSKTWWVSYSDEAGRRRRESIGPDYDEAIRERKIRTAEVRTKRFAAKRLNGLAGLPVVRSESKEE